nr:beta-1,2-xylosyltransferase 1 [Quercus suber]
MSLLPFQFLPPNHGTRLILIAILCAAIVWLLQAQVYGAIGFGHAWTEAPHSSEAWTHPIEGLIAEAEREFERLIQQETFTLHDAAEAYLSRRGRPPPPMFDIWFEYAQNRSAIIVEDFFDQIYTDLNPFWGMPAKQIRARASNSSFTISVRDGKTSAKGTDIAKPRFDVWIEMVTQLQQYLPDIDVPVNLKDESRIVVPWEDIEVYMESAKRDRKHIVKSQMKTRFSSRPPLENLEPFDPEYIHDGPYWPLALAGCPPQSPARTASIVTSSGSHPPFPSNIPIGSDRGFVKNLTRSRALCEIPELQYMHGAIVEPYFISNSKQLFPMFGGSKLSVNNDILIPPAMYFSSDPQYSGGNEHGGPWSNKKDAMIWRGSASGGKNTEENWMRFHRHRFVASINATEINLTESSGQEPLNFVLPVEDAYYLPARANGRLSEWVSTWSNASFVQLLCWPWPPGLTAYCNYTDPYFFVDHSVPMKEQYEYKYLPDIDGNSYSGRYRGFLGSTSLPLKATIYQEWHDSRLIPWYHFVPMDNTFIDIYGIMQYFIGYRDPSQESNSTNANHGRDEQARQIAMQGKGWTEKVIRNDDMLIYMLRLFLEYARVCDDDRNVMGWKASTDLND